VEEPVIEVTDQEGSNGRTLTAAVLKPPSFAVPPTPGAGFPACPDMIEVIWFGLVCFDF